MLGAICGDVIGSPYERRRYAIKHKDFPLFCEHSRFTDDTILTLAVANAILRDVGYLESVLTFAMEFPRKGYGGRFRRWLRSGDHQPYNSFGNGSAMRVSPVGWAFDDETRVLAEAARSAEITHNHPEGIKGAQAVALAVFMARSGATKEQIRDELEARFGYDLHRRLDDIRPSYTFDVSCQGSVPEAIICFLEAQDFEDAVRNAVSLGGDADTQAAIAGSIAEAFYGIHDAITTEVRRRLPVDFNLLIDEFHERFGPAGA